YTNTSYTSSTASENALMITGDGITPTLDGITATKTGDGTSGDGASFYGTNSAIIAKDGAVLTIKNATITTDSEGANGVFSYGGNGGQNGASGDGTTVNISDSTITTTEGGSGGIMTTGGGITNASNLTVTTSGRSSAAIRTDRGGGTVNVDGGTYTTNGLGSPAIYSTAKVSVKNATLVSNKSEGVCIEGTNSIDLTNCTLTANNTEKNGNAQYLDTIMIYQSMSGDASGTDSSFTMTGGTLNSKSGHVFHVTNTSAEINLKGVRINNTDSEGVLLSVANDGWSGAANKATLNAVSQNLEGKIIVSNTASSASDSSSSLTMNLDSSSVFTGSIGDENGSGSSLGTVDVTLNGGWKLTADSYVTSISGSGTIDYNGYTLYVNGTAYTSGTPGGSISEATVTASDDNYITDDTTAEDASDTETEDEKVSVSSTKVTKANRSKNGKKLTVKVAKVSDADGYEVQYSTSSKFTAKTTKKVSMKKTKTTIKKLKKKKTYYVRVRAYKTVNGKKVYSDWSSVKKVS
ncbi:MAG: fibronectin type III domain-containing protein, partial [Eubacterium sp.]|nr:fibronectin type III domain-containing protein [Eubacterium sp.]